MFDMVFTILLLIVPLAFIAITIRDWPKTSTLSGVIGLLGYSVVLIWWGISFFILWTGSDFPAVCGSGFVILAVTRLVQLAIDRAARNGAGADSFAGSPEALLAAWDSEQTKRLILTSFAVGFILCLLCLAVAVISQFLPS